MHLKKTSQLVLAFIGITALFSCGHNQGTGDVQSSASKPQTRLQAPVPVRTAPGSGGCHSNGECPSGEYCFVPMGMHTGICSEYVAAGGSCTQPGGAIYQCVSGSTCNLTTGKCDGTSPAPKPTLMPTYTAAPTIAVH